MTVESVTVDEMGWDGLEWTRDDEDDDEDKDEDKDEDRDEDNDED